MLCIAELNSAISLYIVSALTNIQDSLDRKGLKIVWIPLPSVSQGKMDNIIRVLPVKLRVTKNWMVGRPVKKARRGLRREGPGNEARNVVKMCSIDTYLLGLRLLSC